jgi:hypothetical protein
VNPLPARRRVQPTEFGETLRNLGMAPK